MDAILLLARLFLAGVFALSAITKLMDPDGSRRAIAGFGVPERYAYAGGLALPLAELAIAVLLIPTATAWWGALAGLLLLLGFIAGIVYNLQQGRTPDCHCFGKLHSEPIGAPTIIRDAIFAAVALIIVLFGWNDPGPSTIAWFGELTSWERVLTVAAALLVAAVSLQSWVLFQMVRQNGRLLLRLDAIDQRFDGGDAAPAAASARDRELVMPAGLPLGSPAPAFRLEGVYGETQTLDALRAPGKPVLLVFSSPTCGPCNALMPEIGRWQREYASRLTVAVLARGEAAANRAKSAEHGLANVLLQPDGDVSALYHANATPTAVLVNADGTIGSAPEPGTDAIRSLVSRAMATLAPARAPVAAGRTAPPSPPSPSEPRVVTAQNGAHDPMPEPPVPTASEPERRKAPAIDLPDLDGNPVSLADFAGEPAVVLFWRPGCGFCKRMLPDLKAWEARPPAGAPRLLIVSSESVEANREQGLSSPIVLDPDGFGVGRAYGVGGTPSAVLIDGEGFIAGAPAVGSPRVLAMLGGEELIPEEPSAPPVELKVGDPAPPIALTNLDGAPVSLSDFAGQPTAVLFWSPGCVYCQRMLDDLRAWEAEPPADAPRLLVVSSGDREANRAAGLQAPMVLEEGFGTGRAYGASGTPSALLLDAEGKVAAPLVVGAAKSLALLKYVSASCKACLEECKQQGGGSACRTVCEMGGQCP